MAAKKNLELAPELPKHDLEDLLASRLADDLLNEVDMGKLGKLAIAKIGKKLRDKAINWLASDTSAAIPMSEQEAIEAAVEEVKTA